VEFISINMFAITSFVHKAARSTIFGVLLRLLVMFCLRVGRDSCIWELTTLFPGNGHWDDVFLWDWKFELGRGVCWHFCCFLLAIDLKSVEHGSLGES